MPTLPNPATKPISSILEDLSPDAIRTFRLATSSAAYGGSEDDFREAFRTCLVMFGKTSLEMLDEVSKNPDLAPLVQKLVVCSDHLSEKMHSAMVNNSLLDIVTNDGTKNGTKKVWNGEPRGEPPGCLYSTVYCERLEYQTGLMQSDQAADELSKALSRLVNCESVVLSDRHDPWGRPSLISDIGVNVWPERHIWSDNAIEHSSPMMEEKKETKEFIERALMAMLVAIARSGVKVKHVGLQVGPVDVDSNEWPFEDAVTPDMLSLSTARDELKANQALTNVTALTLVLSTTSSESRVSDVVRFLALFPRLSRLRLRFKDIIAGGFEDLAQAINIPTLQSLELSRWPFEDETELVHLLSRHKESLKQVTLESIGFGTCKDTPQAWLSLLSKVRHELSSSCNVVLKECHLRYDLPGVMYDISKQEDYGIVLADLADKLAQHNIA